MITQYEIPGLLMDEIPDLFTKINTGRVSMEIYTSIYYFTEYTRHVLEEHNFIQAKKCFIIAEKLYRYGDRMVKRLIENNFIFSFTSFMPTDTAEKLLVKSLIPDILYTLYIKQIMSNAV